MKKWSCASAPECRNTIRSSEIPAARGLVGAEQQRRALVDVDVGAHALRVREHDHAVVGRRLRDLVGRVRDARPRVRVVGGHRGEPGPERADVRLVLRDRSFRRGPQRGLEQRVHVRGCDGPVRLLDVVRARSGIADHVGARRSVVGRPFEMDARLAPCSPARVHRFGSADHDDVGVAGHDRGRHLVHEELGLLPPTVLTTVRRGAMPSSCATRAPGSP